MYNWRENQVDNVCKDIKQKGVFILYSLYFGNHKTVWEMQPEERKTTLIALGIMILIAVVIGIIMYLKDKKNKKI